MKKTILFSLFILSGCMFGKGSEETAEPILTQSLDPDMPVVEQDIGELIAEVEAQEENTETAHETSIDQVEFIRNYLAAQMSEYEGKRGEAAIFYDMAEEAFPSYMPLKEKAFSMQLLSGSWDRTVSIARDLITEEETLPLVSIVLAVEEIRAKNFSEARRYIERAIQISPNLIHLKILDAYVRIAEGENVKKITAELRDLPYSAVMSAIKHYHLGNIFWMAGNLDEAELEFTMAFEQDNHSLFTVKGVVGVLEKNNKHEKLESVFETFFKNNPDNIMLLETYNRYKNGEKIMAEAPTLNEAVSGILFNFSTLIASQGSILSGQQMMNMAEVLNPKDTYITFYKGLLLEQEGYIKSALTEYKRVPENSDLYAAAQVRVSNAYQQEKNYKDAAKIAKKLAERYNLPIFKRLLAEIYYTGQFYEDAVEVYSALLAEGAVEASEKDQLARVYFARGSAYERLTQYDKATQDLEKSISFEPNDANALNYLGYMLVDLDKDVKRGMSLITKALILRPNDAAILDSMGWAWYKSGEFDKALSFLKRAISGNPQDPTIHIHMGDTYYKLGRVEDARIYFEKALELGPESEKDKRYVRAKLKELPVKID